MLLTTHTGVVVPSDHITCIALRRELPSPSEPDPEPGAIPLFRVLLGIVTGDFFIAARFLSEADARFVREDIANAWAEGKPFWKASDSLKRRAEGAYFAEEGSASTVSGTDAVLDSDAEKEERDGTDLSALSDL